MKMPWVGVLAVVCVFISGCGASETKACPSPSLTGVKAIVVDQALRDDIATADITVCASSKCVSDRVTFNRGRLSESCSGQDCLFRDDGKLIAWTDPIGDPVDYRFRAVDREGNVLVDQKGTAEGKDRVDDQLGKGCEQTVNDIRITIDS